MRFRWDAGAQALPWVLTLDSLFFAAGITALAILKRWRWAYDFGIAVGSLTLAVGVLGLFAGVGGVRDSLRSAWIEYVALALFLAHLIRHRDQWRDPERDGPQPPGSHLGRSVRG